MKVAGLAIGLFLAAFLLHWMIWRIKIPRRQSAALLVVLLGTLPVGLAVVVYVPAFQFLGPLGFWQCLHAAIFHVMMSLGYVVVYSALEERSPSMSLLTFVADAGPEGRTLEELRLLLAGFRPVESRLQAMIRDHMVVETQTSYQLTAKGRVWAQVFSCWLRLMGASRGG
ncbi:MAG: hypothetical protein ACLP9L_03225 [Thermoguttaceae bacterium]